MTFEVTGEVRLVVKADVDGHLGQRPAFEQSPPGELDPPAENVRVWRNSEAGGQESLTMPSVEL